MRELILVVDDDPIQRRLLEEALTRFGYDVAIADGGAAALAELAGARGGRIAAVVLDLVMPDLDGMSVLTRMRAQGHSIPVIVQTSQGGVDVAVSAMRAGASDFIVKPLSPERLQVSLRNALKVADLEAEVDRSRRRVTGELGLGDISSKASAMERVLKLAERASRSQIPILIEGESGVGKELVARAIQGASERRAKPFVTVNCGAIPENLVESILFGHEKGSFTGALDRHVGKFQEAGGGTIFLDEVGELPPDIQVKLLRVLQEGEVEPVGGKRPVKVDFRLISATNRSLLDLTKAGRFREDLYYRLNVFPIFMPPLRDRKEDIPDLVRGFLARFTAEEKKRQVVGVTSEAMRLLLAYDWPGNVRQLENALFRAVVLADGDMIGIDEFQQIAQLTGPLTGAGAAEAVRLAPARRAEPAVQSREDARANAGGSLWSPGPNGFGEGPAPFGFLRSLDGDGHVRSLADIEAEMIKTAIGHYGGRMSEVARRLGIGRSTLYRKLKDYGLADGDGLEAAE